MSELLKHVTLSNLTGVGKGQTATLSLPVGMLSYHHVYLDLSGVTKVEIKDIRIKINGNVMQEYKTGSELEKVAGFYQRSLSDNILCIPFRRDEFISPTDADAYAFGMADVDTFQIDFTIDAGAANPVIKARALQGAARPLGVITKVKRFSFSSTGAGMLEIDRIPKQAYIQAIHIMTDKVKTLEVKANNESVYDTISRTENQALQKRFKRTPQIGVTHIDWVLKNQSGGALPVAGLHDFRLRLDMTEGTPFDVVVEYGAGFQD